MSELPTSYSYVSCNFIDTLYPCKYIKTLNGKEKVFVGIVLFVWYCLLERKAIQCLQNSHVNKTELLMFYFCEERLEIVSASE